MTPACKAALEAARDALGNHNHTWTGINPIGRDCYQCAAHRLVVAALAEVAPACVCDQLHGCRYGGRLAPAVEDCVCRRCHPAEERREPAISREDAEMVVDYVRSGGGSGFNATERREPASTAGEVEEYAMDGLCQACGAGLPTPGHAEAHSCESPERAALRRLYEAARKWEQVNIDAVFQTGSAAQRKKAGEEYMAAAAEAKRVLGLS